MSHIELINEEDGNKAIINLKQVQAVLWDRLKKRFEVHWRSRKKTSPSLFRLPQGKQVEDILDEAARSFR